MADVYALCRGVVKTLQDREIKFNHHQRELLVKTFSLFLDNLESAFRKDDRLRMCAKALSELWRVMTYAEMLVAEWANEDWWKSVMCSSVSASLQMHMDVLLQDFIRCLDIAKIAVAETTLDQAFKLPIMDHSEFLAAFVEEAHMKDTEALVRQIAALKEGKSFLQRRFSSSYGLSKYLLRKFQHGSPSSPEARPYYALDFRCIEMADTSMEKGLVGTVFECKCFGMPAVAKCFSFPGDDSIKTLEEEVARLTRLQHPNLIHFIGYTARESQHMLIMERGRENLKSYLARNGAKASNPLNLLKALDILLQIGEGMRYLHESNVIHGNLKISDIILNAMEKKNTYEDNFWCVQVKLADYGLSRLKQCLRPSSPGRASEAANNVDKHARSGDVYSFAMVMYEILMGCKPFEHLLPRDILPKLLTGWRPELNPKSRCPGHLSAYLQRCWATNPRDRPLFPEICSMLSYCKGVILRHSFPSPLSCINAYDAEILSSRLGSKWCIQEGARGNLPLEVYGYSTFDITRRAQKLDVSRILSGVDEVAEVMKAGRHFGNWTSQACDLNKAFKLFKSIQHHEHPEALWRLGLCYELGHGVSKSDTTAVSLYERARDLGFASANIDLGLCHATGHGVDGDVDRSWSAALKAQTSANATLLSIQELLHNLAAGMSACTLDSENAYIAMTSRLELLSSHDTGLLLIHGPDGCNAPLLRRIKRKQAKLLKKLTTDRSTIAAKLFSDSVVELHPHRIAVLQGASPH